MTANPDTLEVTFHRDVRVPTADPSVTLGADLYLPDVPGPVPLLVMVLPYRKDLGGADLLLPYFARRGYAGLIVDVLGTGRPDGVARAPMTADEAQDAVDAITWGAAQPWCDGNVGMWGHSYGAMLTMRAAARQPAALKAIIPVQGMIDPEVDFVHPDRARGFFGPTTWLTGMLGNFLLPPMHAPDDSAALARWQTRLDETDPHVLDLLRPDAGDPFWQDQVLDATRIKVPALCFAGWRDLFADAQVRAFESMQGPKRLIAGPWMHVLPVVSTEGSLDFFGICLAWWDRWLKGVDNGADAQPSAAFVQGPTSYWASVDEWPEHRTTAAVSGCGSTDLILEPTNQRLTADNTLGMLGGLTRLPFAGFGMPTDQHDDDLRSDCWTSRPLAEALGIVGRPEVTLATPSSGRVIVKLTHVDPAGRSILITSGCVGEGRGSVQIQQVTLDVTAYEVPAGHRIRVVVTDADFPRLAPRPAESPGLPGLASVSLPVLMSDDLQVVDLPEEPAYLAAMLSAAADANRPNWTLAREVLSGRLTMSIENATAGESSGPGPHIQSTSSTVASTSPDGSAGITTSNRWTIQWPAQPATSIDVQTELTGSTLTARARIAAGDVITFEKSWSAAAGDAVTPIGGPR